MTKAFLHGRTEAIRTVQPESVNFVKASRHDRRRTLLTLLRRPSAPNLPQQQRRSKHFEMPASGIPN